MKVPLNPGCRAVNPSRSALTQPWWNIGGVLQACGSFPASFLCSPWPLGATWSQNSASSVYLWPWNVGGPG